MDSDYLKISDLLLHLADDSVTPEEMQELEHLLNSNPDGFEFGLELLLERHLIRNECKQFLVSECSPVELSGSFDLDLWERMAQYEMEAPGLERQPVISVPEKVVIRKVAGENAVRKINKMSLYTAVVSLAALLLILAYLHFAPVPQSLIIGQITRAVNAQWADPSGTIREGSDICTGVMELTRGLAEITLSSGAKVIVQAPAEFELEANNQIYLKNGRLVADVHSQEEKYFVVRTANAAIVDFGTEFGVDFADGKTQTHVFDGEVEIRNSSNLLRYEKGLPLKKGQGGQVDNDGALSVKEEYSNTFVRSEEFDARVNASKGSAYHQWLAYSYALRRDPSLVAYYTFETDPAVPEQVTNLSGVTSGHLNGLLMNTPESRNPIRTNGRWPEKTALQFDRNRQQYLGIPSDEAVNLDGPVTLVAWVKCPGNKDGGHIISNRMLNGGACNYQLGYRTSSLSGTRDSIHIARKKETDDWSNHIFSNPLKPFSGWMMIAVTHDNQNVCFYRDGQLVDSRPWQQRQDAIDADLWIGTDGTTKDAFYFNGMIDEIAIFKRALNAAEIQRMHEAEKP